MALMSVTGREPFPKLSIPSNFQRTSQTQIVLEGQTHTGTMFLISKRVEEAEKYLVAPRLDQFLYCWRQFGIELIDELRPFLAGVLQDVICKIHQGKHLLYISASAELSLPKSNNGLCILQALTTVRIVPSL